MTHLCVPGYPIVHFDLKSVDHIMFSFSSIGRMFSKIFKVHSKLQYLAKDH